MKETMKNKGITLIALVITIIVLLILAGITIASITGENGILRMAEQASKKTKQSQEIEGIELAMNSSIMEDVSTLEVKKEIFEKELNKYFGDREIEIQDNRDGSFLVKFADTKRTYYIESNGKIISSEDFIKIETAEELKQFRNKVNTGNDYEGKYIILTQNITLNTEEQWEPIGLFPNSNSILDNENNKPFKGIFDGQNYEVNGININTEDKAQGFFGLVSEGKILNLIIGVNNNISGGNVTGGVCGYLYNNGIISNCVNKSDININSGGGIVGCLNKNGLIVNCSNEGNVVGKHESGGIVGIVGDNCSIKFCNNSGDVTTSESWAGGIISKLRQDSVCQFCWNAGEIFGSLYVGGIVAGNGCEIGNCRVECVYNRGKVEGSRFSWRNCW